MTDQTDRLTHTDKNSTTIAQAIQSLAYEPTQLPQSDPPQIKNRYIKCPNGSCMKSKSSIDK